MKPCRRGRNLEKEFKTEMNDSMSLKLAVWILGACFLSGGISASDSINYINTGPIKALNFGKQISNAALNVSIQKTVLVESEFHCQMQCVMHGTCLSYNFGTTPASGTARFPCQLSATDRFTEIQRFDDDAVGYVHRGVMVSCRLGLVLLNNVHRYNTCQDQLGQTTTIKQIAIANVSLLFSTTTTTKLLLLYLSNLM